MKVNLIIFIFLVMDLEYNFSIKNLLLLLISIFWIELKMLRDLNIDIDLKCF